MFLLLFYWIGTQLDSKQATLGRTSSCLSSCFSLLTFHAELHADYSYRTTVRHLSVLPDLQLITPN